MKRDRSDDAAQAYLDLFFPIHYMVGIAIEDELRCGRLTRQQTCILWLIRTRGEAGRTLRRKEVERALSSWFEVTSSAVSKALRGLARPPLELIELAEDPQSGREKLVHLTPLGERFLSDAIDNGVDLMRWMTAQLTPDEIEGGIHFLSRVAEIFSALPDARATPGAAEPD